MTENGENNTEEVEESPDLELERLNTLLATTENNLREMTNERNKERILREKYEKDIVLLKGDTNRLEREKDNIKGQVQGKENDVAKEREKKQQAVARANAMQTELDTLRRSAKALERQLESFEACANSKPAVEEKG